MHTVAFRRVHYTLKEVFGRPNCDEKAVRLTWCQPQVGRGADSSGAAHAHTGTRRKVCFSPKRNGVLFT